MSKEQKSNKRLKTARFSPKTVDEYLLDRFNLNIYNDICDNMQGIFEPAEFFNVLFEQIEIVKLNQDQLHSLRTHLLSMGLNDIQLYYLMKHLISLLVIENGSIWETSLCGMVLSKELKRIRLKITDIFTEKYKLKTLEGYLNGLDSIEDKIDFLQQKKGNFEQDDLAYELLGRSFMIDFDKKIDELSKILQKQEQIQVKSSPLATHTNLQISIMLVCFLETYGVKVEIIKATNIARFLHLITGKEFKDIQSSGLYEKLRDFLPVSTVKVNVRKKNLLSVRSLFEKVGLNKVVSKINDDLANLETSK